MSRHSRRGLLHWAVIAVFAAMPLAAHAETYPSHPARIIVGFPAGGPQDITARLIAQWLSDHLGQQFLVESRAGAGGTLGAEYVVNSPPDGYTLLLRGPPNTIGVDALRQAEVEFRARHGAGRRDQPGAAGGRGQRRACR